MDFWEKQESFWRRVGLPEVMIKELPFLYAIVIGGSVIVMIHLITFDYV